MRPAKGSLEAVETVELVTVGVDVGSSTTHLSVSKVRLERLATELSSRYVLTGRQELWRSPVLLTPYVEAGARIDAEALADFVAEAERSSGVGFDEIDTGAVLLTGSALERANSRAVADAVARDTGRFVCAAAGHHLEAELAAHGSGGAALSRDTGSPVLAVDVGGSTTKLALCEGGAVVSTCALSLGSRLVAWDATRRLVRLEHAGQVVGAELGERLEVGSVLSPETERRLARAMARSVVSAIMGSGDDLAGRLWLTEPAAWRPAPVVTFSGGVSEFLDGREQGDFGDLGQALAEEVRRALESEASAPKVVQAAEGIRATVIGASQFSTQVSGSTVLVPEEAGLPVHGIPVVRPEIAPDRLEPAAVTGAVRRAVATREEAIDTAGAVALAFSWSGDPSHQRLRALSEGIADGLSEGAARDVRLVVLVVDRDLGASLGRILREEIGLRSPVVVALDGLELGSMDFVDLAAPRPPSGVVPVVVKSLLFAPVGPARAEHTRTTEGTL